MDHPKKPEDPMKTRETESLQYVTEGHGQKRQTRSFEAKVAEEAREDWHAASTVRDRLQRGSNRFAGPEGQTSHRAGTVLS